MKKNLIWLAKIGVSAAILGYLCYKAWQDHSFDELMNQPKHGGLLAAALLTALTAMLLTVVRWYILVRALELPFTVPDALRLGFIGHFFTFVTLGVVGGDLLKAIFIAREQSGRKTEAVASVIIDRVIGLYALFLMAGVAFLLSDLSQPQVLRVCQATVILAIGGTCGLALLLVPGVTDLRLWNQLTGIPKLGGFIGRAISAVKMYRRKRLVLAASLVMSLGAHALSTLSVYFVACGLPGESPTLGTHFVIVPIAMVANAIPLPGGLGAFEAALDFLYRGVAEVGFASERGFVVALGYRLITMLLGLIGVYYYVAGRRQVSALIQVAEESPEDGPDSVLAMAVAKQV